MPTKYGYEQIDLSYFSSNFSPSYLQTSVISLLSHAISDDPQQFSDAIGIPKWDASMKEKYYSLMKNHTWDFVPLPKGQKLVRCKWVYRTKYATDGSIDKNKA